LCRLTAPCALPKEHRPSPRRAYRRPQSTTGLVAIPVVSALIGVYQTYQNHVAGIRMTAYLRGRLFERLQRLDL
jgi:ABC-type multidrug transport system fused ATPase/permease subunit